MHITALRRRGFGGELNIAATLMARLLPEAAPEDAPAPSFQQYASPSSRPAPTPAATAPVAAPRIAAAELPSLRSVGIPTARAEPAWIPSRMEASIATQGDPRPSWWQGLCDLRKGFR